MHWASEHTSPSLKYVVLSSLPATMRPSYSPTPSTGRSHIPVQVHVLLHCLPRACCDLRAIQAQ